MHAPLPARAAQPACEPRGGLRWAPAWVGKQGNQTLDRVCARKQSQPITLMHPCSLRLAASSTLTAALGEPRNVNRRQCPNAATHPDAHLVQAASGRRLGQQASLAVGSANNAAAAHVGGVKHLHLFWIVCGHATQPMPSSFVLKQPAGRKGRTTAQRCPNLSKETTDAGCGVDNLKNLST